MNLSHITEPLAKQLEGCAACMDAAGVGGHLVHGHQAFLKRMAAHVRAAGAQGQLPSVYSDGDFLHAAAEPAVFDTYVSNILRQF